MIQDYQWVWVVEKHQRFKMILWLINQIPLIVIHIIVAVGVVSLVSSNFLPKLYSVPITIVGIAIIAIGIFLEGLCIGSKDIVDELNRAKEKVAQMEQQGKQETAKVDTKVVTRTKVIHERGQVIKQYIDREITKYDSQCVIPQEFVKAHNDAAEVPPK